MKTEELLLNLMQLTSDNAEPTFDKKCVKYCADLLEKLGFSCDYQIFGEGEKAVPNLFATLGDKEKPTLCFAGHCDVVPFGAEWTKNPHGEIVENELYGRGAVDMLGGVASFLSMLQNLSKNELDEILKKYRIAVLLTGDEEVMTANGMRAMVKYLLDKGEKIDYCILGEPTAENECLDGMLNYRGGSLCFTIEINGKQSHIAAKERINPITIGAQIVLALKELKYPYYSNFEVSSFNAPNETTNLILEKSNLKANCRFDARNDPQQMIKDIDEICKKYAINGYNFVVDDLSTGYMTGETKFVNSLLKTMKKFNKNAEIREPMGVSDGYNIKQICKEIVEVGLIAKYAHQIDEKTTISDLKMLTDFYKTAIFDLMEVI